MSSQNRPAKLHPARIRKMFAAGMTFKEIRKVVKVGHERLKRFVIEHQIEVVESPQLIAARMRGKYLVGAGEGGDKAMRELMAGRTFDRWNMTGDYREPRHIPHSAPGDDFSGCGGSL